MYNYKYKTMKKRRNCAWRCHGKSWRKMLMFMKLLSVLLFGVCMSVSASVLSQNARVTVDMRNVALTTVLEELGKQSKCDFFYNYALMQTKGMVSVKAENRELGKVLEELLPGLGLAFTFDRNVVVIREKVDDEKPKSVRVKGYVFDKQKQSMPGVTVKVSGLTIGTSTNAQGWFALDLPMTSGTLEFTFIGFKKKTLDFTEKMAKDTLRITMEEDVQELDETVVVAFGQQKKESVVSAITTVRPMDLKSSSSDLTTSFAGKIAGIVGWQTGGLPGALTEEEMNTKFYIRGITSFQTGANIDPLILIDGVESSKLDLARMAPEDIESFSVLKDATATALYGSRGANGVMIVKTKSGRESDKAIVNIRLENAYSTHTKTPKFVDGVRYMEMYNEAVLTRGTGEVLYSDNKIAGTRAGLDPLIYPNVNWYDELFRSGAMNQNINVTIRGGSKKLDYFSSVSVNHDSGVLRNTDDFSYKNNLNIMRYVFQNNFNLNLSKSSKLSLNLNVQLRDYSGPTSNTSDLFGMVMESNPVDFPVRFPDDPNVDYIRWGGKSGGKYNSGFRNPYAEMARGYQSQFESTVMANLKFEQKLDFITEGLSAEALFSFKNWSSTNTDRSAGYNQFQVINYNTDNLSDYTLNRIGSEQSTVLQTSNKSSGDRRLYIQAMINYNRTFNTVHNVSGMFLYNQDQYNGNAPEDLIESLPQRKQGFAGRVTYAYDYRYMAELNFGYNGSENFAKGNRFGFFPSVAIGYNISREKFFEKFSDVVSNLKLRASWGLVGNDQIGGERYIYLSNIELENGDLGYTTGRDQNISKNGPKYIRYANNDITWEVGSKWNFGIDLGIKNELNITFDIFKEIRNDIFMERQQIPDYWGTNGKDKWMNLATKMYGNLGKVENKGLDFSIDYVKRFNNDFDMSFKGTFTYAHNKVLEYDEPDFQKYPNISRVGHSVDQQLLYIAERLFIDDSEVQRNPKQNLGGWVSGGDIKYKNLPDVNGNYDNVIDSNDRQYTGMPTTPEIVYGFGPSFRYKKFDFSFFFQGAARVSIMMNGIHPFGAEGIRNVLQFIADDYWSETNQNIYAEYPRLSKRDNENNTKASTYWQRNGAFLKLKNLEVGFNHKFFRVYLRGSNLLTFSPFKYWDPEMGSGSGLSYPTQRVFNVGVQFSINK